MEYLFESYFPFVYLESLGISAFVIPDYQGVGATLVGTTTACPLTMMTCNGGWSNANGLNHTAEFQSKRLRRGLPLVRLC